MTNDPFAEVSAEMSGTPSGRGGEGGAAAAVAADPFTATADMDDPFATSDDYRGGPFTPSPPIEMLRGRLLAMFPRKFEADAPNPFDDGKDPANKTRELYTVDLYVLDGGSLKYPYKQRGNPEATDPAEREDQHKEYDAGSPTPAEPFVIKGSWVPQGTIIGKLKRAHTDGVPFLGVLDLIPQAQDYKKGMTAAKKIGRAHV